MHEELFPREVITHVPRVTLTGNERLHVEQHQGVIAYSPEEILLRTASGMLRINGTELRFSTYNAGEALIIGRIEDVGYLVREGRS